MNIDTKYFGQVTIKEKDLFSFPKGLPGFSSEKKFALLNIPDNPAFLILQSTTDVNVAFVMISPHQVDQNYEVKLDVATRELLEIESIEDVHLLGIITLKDTFSESTINLQAPIILNHKQRLGKQYITNHKAYSTRTPIASVREQGA